MSALKPEQQVCAAATQSEQQEAVHGGQPAEIAPPSSDDQPKTTAAKASEPAEMTAASAATKRVALNLAVRKPELPAYLANNSALTEFFNRLPSIITGTGHSEMWGVLLKGTHDAPTVNVLIKFLRANGGNVNAAENQLRKALEWRKEVDPLALAESGRFNASKFAGLGYLTTYEENGCSLVIAWNIYGAVKDTGTTFADADEFVKWRAALMELAVQELNMKDAKTVIDYAHDSEDPYQMIQVHDYLNVKFFRMDPTVRAATRKTIEVLSTAYPELLREKFFVNVPAIMGWMFSAMKVILSRNTTRKFHPITNGVNLAREFPADVVELIPKVYGGKGPELKDQARTVQLADERKDESAGDNKPREAANEPAAPQEHTANKASQITAEPAPAAAEAK